MAFTAGHTSSCFGLRTRKVFNDCILQRRTPRLVTKPGSYQATAAAGEVAFIGELADVQQISLGPPQPVPQQHLVGQQFHAELSHHQLDQQPQQQSHVLPLPLGCRHDQQQQHYANGHTAAASSAHGGSGCNGNSSRSEDATRVLNGHHWHDHQCGAAAQQSLPLLLHVNNDHQQHIDRLLSNALASTSAAADLQASSSLLSINSSSSSKQTVAGADTLHQHHQEHYVLQQARSQQHSYTPASRTSSTHSSSDSSRSSSRSRELPSRQLVRPNSSPVGARTASPAQIAAVANVLLMQEPAAQLLLDRVPQLLQLEPSAMQDSIQQLSHTLGVTYKQAAYMSARQPEQLLFRPAQELLEAAQQLAVAVGLPGRNGSLRGARVVINAAVHAPALLVQPQKGLAKRLLGISSWFDVSVETALSMVGEAPELLTDSFAGIQRRVQALRDILLLWPVAAQRLALKFPSVLFLSPRIVNNKVKVLMAIMHKDRKAIGLLVYKTPQLLRCHLERVRICYQMLPVVLQRSEGFVYAMSAHNAQLLLLPPPKLLVRGARLLAALQMVSEWQQQWQQLRPPQVEEGFASKYHRFKRLEYLVATQQTSSVGILEALRLKPEVFEQRFSGWGSWWAAKQQRLQQYQQQQQQQAGPGRGADSSLQQQRQQQCQQSICAGVGLTAEQQQLQQHYQQLVHEHLRQLQQRHQQRQMQLQQYRVQLLQQRALRWQQLQQQLQRRQQQQPDVQQQQQQQQQQGEHLELVAQHVVQTAANASDCQAAAVHLHSSNSEGSSSQGGVGHFEFAHFVAPTGSSTTAAATAVVAQAEQQQLQHRQLSGSHAVAAAAAECTVERVSVATEDASSPALVAGAGADVAEHQQEADDIVIQPQQRKQQQQQQQQQPWRRQQSHGLLHGHHHRQQQQLWQPAAVVEGC